MDQKIYLDHLAITEKAIALGKADLDCAGHETELALAVLATCRQAQAEYVAHRNRLLKSLQQHGCTDAKIRPGLRKHPRAGEASRDSCRATIVIARGVRREFARRVAERKFQ
jgi:hypothetical protein